MDAFQDHYASDVSHCYGCGSENAHGHQIKTVWEGEETVTRFTPEAYHTAMPGFVYGGLIASLIDCHSTGTAAAALARSRSLDAAQTLPRCVTGSLHVDYLKPTPLGVELVIRGRITEQGARKVRVASEVWAGEVLTARGEVLAIEAPDNFGRSA